LKWGDLHGEEEQEEQEGQEEQEEQEEVALRPATAAVTMTAPPEGGPITRDGGSGRRPSRRSAVTAKPVIQVIFWSCSDMIFDVLKRLLYFVGRTTARLILAASVLFLAVAYGGTPQGSPVLLVVFIAATLVAVVAHELGHLLACRAVGVKVKAFRIGDERYAIRFRVRTVQVSLGWPYKGRVEHEGTPSVGRQAVITLAGSLLDLALAGLVLTGSRVAGFDQAAWPVTVAVALGFAVTGLANLLPYRSRSSGRLSDGARLFELRSDARAAELRAVHKETIRLLRTGSAEELLELHAGLDDPSEQISKAQAVARTAIELNVVLLPGLPEGAARLAERRVAMLVRRPDLGRTESTAHLALALLLLRQGGWDDCAAAEQHCARALAVKDVRDSARVAALSAVIVSRQARGLPDDDVRTMAAAWPALPDGLEASVAGLKAILDPEAMLRAFRAGDPAAQLGVGDIAAMLRGQGRIGDLLDLHAGFETPAGRDWQAQAQSLHNIEYNLLCVPGLPSAVIDQAAVRVRWLTDTYPFKAGEDAKPLRSAMEHTLALARLRQRRFDEVEPLCTSALVADLGPDERATVLATIVMARRALGQPHADLLAEAVALSPGADLVAEARSTAHQAPVAQPSRPSS
jgi:Zn-dependent protease